MIDHDDTVLLESLGRARFEIIPMKGIDEQIPYLPPDATVTVTSSPTKGIDATLELAERLRRDGFYVVPHLAARLVSGDGHLRDILGRVEDMGITEVFVVAGDAKHPAGPYEGASDLLRAMAAVGHGLSDIGITGYPESHSFISDATTIQAMYDKAPYATYIVSQICYDASVVAWWVGAVRDRGISLPIHIGLPGVVDRARLMRISMKVGLGDSLRFLHRQGGVAARLLGGYSPDDLVYSLAPQVRNEPAKVRGWHLFTFNEVEQTEQWRQHMLSRVRGAQQA
jgi:methylenetetrahydrofolate reductase (NADPH)